MSRSLEGYPKLFIDLSYPAECRNCTVYVISDSRSARDFMLKYRGVRESKTVCIDIRQSNYRVQSLFLKFLETTVLKVVIWATEYISPTIVSRCYEVHKKPIIIQSDKEHYLIKLCGDNAITNKIVGIH